eukprot:TRINITY_DN16372_c0_g1_i3.p1 TRINITY_DN16372_c0_g1~~TRINITY_DN16372_c0_g1_i3.p1  ORF type:complete len:119 (+),score=19.44 TRINITY_DN16372_c0_g1_i3:3-359(+)
MDITSWIQAMVDERMQQLFLASSTGSASPMVTTPSASGSAMTISGLSGTHDATWIFDSGASYHMTNDVSQLHNCHTPASSIPSTQQMPLLYQSPLLAPFLISCSLSLMFCVFHTSASI